MSKIEMAEELKTDEELEEAAGPDRGKGVATAQDASMQKQASAQQIASAHEHGKKMRRHLTGSIYLWACGEKSEKDEEDIGLSEMLIGWLVPLLQGLAYAMLIERAGALYDPNTANSNYSMASVTGAMYILVAYTTPDLRAGFSLLVDGFHLYHRMFGVALLILYGLMISAAMQVLFYSAGDDASVVINAVTVLFIADVDEKALSFFATVPRKWRLFWAIYTVGISFALALVGLMYVGSAFVSVDDKSPNMNALDRVPGWFICVVNPGAVTVFAFCLSGSVRALAEACCETDQDCGVPRWRMVLAVVFVRAYKAVARAKEFCIDGPCFCVVLALWLVHGVVAWWFLLEEFFGSGLDCSSSSNSSTSTSSAENDSSDTSTSLHIETSTVSIDDSDELYVALVVAYVVLAVGFVLKAVVVWMHRQKSPSSIDGPQRSSTRLAGPAKETRLKKFGCSRVPSLLFGWGIGYWITSCLMGGTLYSDGWANRPLALKAAGYIILPWFFVAVIIFMADHNFLGMKCTPYLKYMSLVLEDTRGGWSWIFSTVIRDVVCIWLFMWYFLVPCLNNI